MLTYNTIYSYSILFSCNIIVYWYTRIDLERKEKEEKKNKKRKRKCQTLSLREHNKENVNENIISNFEKGKEKMRVIT